MFGSLQESKVYGTKSESFVWYRCPHLVQFHWIWMIIKRENTFFDEDSIAKVAFGSSPLWKRRSLYLSILSSTSIMSPFYVVTTVLACFFRKMMRSCLAYHLRLTKRGNFFYLFSLKEALGFCKNGFQNVTTIRFFIFIF